MEERICFIREMLREKHLEMWTLEISSRMEKSAGQVRYRRDIYTKKPYDKKIRFSRTFLLSADDDRVIEVVLHEIAHALDVEKRGYSCHDSVWRSILRGLGAKDVGRRYELSDQEVSNRIKNCERKMYVYECPNCKKQSIFYRKLRKRYACGSCSGRVFNPDYELKLKSDAIS